jgi:hAT family C-terminal dimerisation region
MILKFLLSYTFSPRKTHIIKAMKTRGKTFLKNLWNRKGEADGIPTAEPEIDEPEDPQPPEDQSDMVDNHFAIVKLTKPNNIAPKTIAQMIDNLKLARQPNNFDVKGHHWDRNKVLQPELYALAEIVFFIPPTQVSVERAFSALRLVLSHLRFKLFDSILKDILLVKLNYELVPAITLSDDEMDNLLA